MRRVLLMLLLLAGPAAAAEPDEVLQNPSLEARAVEIGQNLRCVVCASEPIESSRADMARDMRLLVRERIEAGDTDAQIYAFMQARYGDFVLFRPPFRPETWALWLGPFALMAGLIGWAALAARRRRAVPGPAPLTDAERAELDRLRYARPLDAPARMRDAPATHRRGAGESGMSDIVLLDGGMGQELIARAEGPPTPMWSAAVLERQPGLVTAVHRDFAAAGATLATVNAYAATPERLARLTPPAEVDARFEALQRAALDAARSAGVGALAGCLPPLGGSYHPEAAPDPAAMRTAYDRIVALQAPHCAVMLAETMSSVREARAATEAIRAAGARAWTALSVDDADPMRLRSGEALAEGVAAAVAAGAEALLLNCSRPEAISAGMGVLAEAGLPFGAYANGFEDAAELAVGGTVAGMATRADLGPEAHAAHAMGWIGRGATIVGGCCEVGPAHIARLARAIRDAGHRIVAP